MLSRVADAFYWMSRYLERAERSARVITVHRSLVLDDPAGTISQALLGSLGTPPAGYGRPPLHGEPDSESTDPRHRAGVAACVSAARENARQIREQISAEMWEQLNTMYLELAQPTARRGGRGFMDAVIDGAYLFHGVTAATLSQGHAWHYLQLGRYLERASTTAAMLQVYSMSRDVRSDRPAAASEYVEGVGLLRACAAFEAYCRYYTADLRPERLAEFLLLNPEFPQSVRFAADRIEDSLRALGRASRKPNGRPERLAGRLRSALSYGTIDEIIEDSLTDYLESIGKQCHQIHAALYQTYIAYPIDTAIAV